MSIFKNNFLVGVTAALTATIIAPVIIPAIKRSGRPIAKSLVKGGILLYEKGREVVANTGEVMEDVIAEVRVERGQGERPFSETTMHEGTDLDDTFTPEGTDTSSSTKGKTNPAGSGFVQEGHA